MIFIQVVRSRLIGKSLRTHFFGGGDAATEPTIIEGIDGFLYHARNIEITRLIIESGDFKTGMYSNDRRLNYRVPIWIDNDDTDLLWTSFGIRVQTL